MTTTRYRPRYATDNAEREQRSGVYHVACLDWRTDYQTIVYCAYVGETERDEFVRFMEHLYDQWFRDIIVGPPRLVKEIDDDEERVDEEKAEVERQLPQYNVEWQPDDNPNRVPKFDAERMYLERQAARAAGKPISSCGHSRYQLGEQSMRKVKKRGRGAPAQPDPEPAHPPAPTRSRWWRNVARPERPRRAPVQRTKTQVRIRFALLWLALWAGFWAGSSVLIDALTGYALPPEAGACGGAVLAVVVLAPFVRREGDGS